MHADLDVLPQHLKMDAMRVDVRKTSAGSVLETSGDKSFPVERVTDLLKKMQAELTRDAANDQVIMDRMDCCTYQLVTTRDSGGALSGKRCCSGASEHATETYIPTDEIAEMPQERISECVAEQIVHDRVIMDRMDCGCVSNRKEVTESTAEVGQTHDDGRVPSCRR